jgi:hypothetical protein
MRKYPRRHARGPFARATKRNGSSKHSVKFSALFYFLCKVTILTFENLETRNYHTPPEPAPHPNLIPRSSAVLRPGMPPQKLRTRQTRTYTYTYTRVRPPDPSARRGAHAAGPCCIGSECAHASHETRAKPLHACTHGIGTLRPRSPGSFPFRERGALGPAHAGVFRLGLLPCSCQSAHMTTRSRQGCAAPASRKKRSPA